MQLAHMCVATPSMKLSPSFQSFANRLYQQPGFEVELSFQDDVSAQPESSFRAGSLHKLCGFSGASAGGAFSFAAPKEAHDEVLRTKSSVYLLGETGDARISFDEQVDKFAPAVNGQPSAPGVMFPYAGQQVPGHAAFTVGSSGRYVPAQSVLPGGPYGTFIAASPNSQPFAGYSYPQQYGHGYHQGGSFYQLAPGTAGLVPGKAHVYLCNRALWLKFHRHQTEMIITKQGR